MFCTLANMDLEENISDANDKPSKEITLGLFGDLSKAFDTINHTTLIKLIFTKSEAHLMIGPIVISSIDINTQISIRFDL